MLRIPYLRTANLLQQVNGCNLHTTALVVFCFFFALVTLAGFWAARWRRPKAGMGSLEEWGLAGRSFGTWVTWFLIGGDLYTAYTVIAVPASAVWQRARWDSLRCRMR